jgi:hypothetical protein
VPVTVKIDPTLNSQQAQIIEDATEFNDGVMTAAQVRKLDRPFDGFVSWGTRAA